ncbi:MAG: cupin domain-containing protein [Ignavibacteria bacterium]
MEPIKILEKFELFNTYWDPKVIAELNGQYVKLVKFKGEFIWHIHENEDELFYVIKGKFTMNFRNKVVEIKEGEMLIVPRGTEHKSSAEEEVWVMVFEPVTTLNTGNVSSELTPRILDKL